MFRYTTDVGTIRLHRAFVDLKNEKVNVNDLQLNNSNVFLLDTDTTTKPEEDKGPVKWHITANNITLSSSKVYIKITKPNILINTTVKKIFAHNADADILRHIYKGDVFLLESGKGQFAMKDDLRRTNSFFDYQNIEFDIKKLEAENFFNQLANVKVNVKQFTANEASGLSIEDMQAKYSMDSIAIDVKDFAIKTSRSNLEANIYMPWSILKQNPKSEYKVRMKGSIDLVDIEKASAIDILKNTYFNKDTTTNDNITQKLNIDISSVGSLSNTEIKTFNISVDDAIYLETDGNLKNILSKSLSGYLDLNIRTDKNINSLVKAINPKINQIVNVPYGTELSSILKINNSNLDINTIISKDETEIMALKGIYNLINKGYNFEIQTNGLNLQEFCHQYNFNDINADIKLSGNSFDFFNRKTKSTSSINIYNINANGVNLTDVTLLAYLNNGEINISSNSINPGFDYVLQADGIINSDNIKTALTLQVDSINTSILGLNNPLEGKCLLTGELYSDFKNKNKVNLNITDALVNIDNKQIILDDLSIDAKTTNEDISLNLSSGNWYVKAFTKVPINQINNKINKLNRNVDNIINLVKTPKQTKTNIDSVLNNIPTLNLEISACGDNPIKRYIAQHYIKWSDLVFNISKSNDKGLVINGDISNLVYQNNIYDKISVDMNTIKHTSNDSTNTTNRLTSKVEIKKKEFGTSQGYKINTEFDTNLQDLNIKFSQKDKNDKTKYGISLSALFAKDKYNVKINESQPIMLGYKTFFPNQNNFLEVTKDKYFINSDISIKDTNNSMLSILSKHEGDRQNINLKINKFGLELLNEFGIKDIKGVLFGDIQYNRLGDIHQQPTISGDISVNDLSFENKKIGHLALAMFYEQRDQSSHYITAQLMRDGNNILSADGIYTQSTEKIDGNLTLNKLPLSIINPFIEKTTQLDGFINSDITVNGKISDINILGNINFEEATVKVPNYGIDAIISRDDIIIRNKELQFNNFRVYSKADLNNPLTIDGVVDIHNLKKIKTDLKIKANEITLVKQDKRDDYKQVLYGKLIASTNIDVRGPISSLDIDGNLNIISGTAINYVLQNSELSYSDKFANLVQFTNLTDSIFEKKEKTEKSLNGIDISIRMRIDPSVRFGLDLTPDHQNYARLQGGGTISFKIPNVGDMSMLGKIELQNDGELKYTIPVVGIPFNSYISKETTLSWNGKVTNPYLNFIANSKVKSTVRDKRGKSSQVDFIVSLCAKDYLDKIDLKFDLAAKNNIDIQNQLANMNEEERAKQALSLLSTGIYLADQTPNSIDFNNALSSIVQSQINKASSTLLQGTDINMGVDYHNGDGQTGTYTDYNYSITKRFLNDRIRILFGGKLQTGNIPTNKEQTLIDNLSIEYRLDRIGLQYLSLFHKRVTDDILEGEYTETGGSYLLRSKLSKFTDLFRILNIYRKDENKDKEPQTVIVKPFILNSKTQKNSIK